MLSGPWWGGGVVLGTITGIDRGVICGLLRGCIQTLPSPTNHEKGQSYDISRDGGVKLGEGLVMCLACTWRSMQLI